MRTRLLPLSALVLAAACSGSGSGVTGTYAAANGEPVTIELKSGGAVTLVAEGMGTSSGTYTVDGEKIIVSLEGQTHTFIKDGSCMEEGRGIFGKLCKGGKAGAAGNVSSRSVPLAPAGTWAWSGAEGEFKLEFQPGNRLRLTATQPGGQPEAQEGTFVIDGDQIQATLDQSVPMTLRFVNNTWESTSFGFAMTFVKR